MHEVIQMYKIKELAELYGIHTNVLRFYEKKGLLPTDFINKKLMTKPFIIRI